MKLPTLERNQRTERDFSPREEIQAPVHTPPPAPVEKPATIPPLPPENTTKSKHPIRRWLLPLAGVGAVVLLGGLGYRQWQYVSTHQETDNATVAGHIHPIASRITGTVAEVLVHENQWVQKGQLLVQLDPTDYQVKVAEAQANLEAAIRKAKAAEVNIAFTAKTAEATATQARGDANGAEAAIANAQAQVTEAQAGIANAQSQVTEARSGIANAEAQVTAAKADILKTKAQSAQSTANLQKAKLDLNRYEELYQTGAVSRQTLDTARQTYQVALAQTAVQQEAEHQAAAMLTQAQQAVTAARAKLAQAQQGVASANAKRVQAEQGVATARANSQAARGGTQQAAAKAIQTQVSQSDYATSQAAIAQAAAALKNAQLQLSYTRILAPSTGRVGHKTVEVGQQVQTQMPLMAVVDDSYWITANFKETQLENIRPNEPVEIKLDSFPNRRFTGKVESVGVASGATFALLPPDNATGNFTKIVQRVPVKIVFDSQSLQNNPVQITPGMSAAVAIQVQ